MPAGTTSLETVIGGGMKRGDFIHGTPPRPSPTVPHRQPFQTLAEKEPSPTRETATHQKPHTIHPHTIHTPSTHQKTATHQAIRTPPHPRDWSHHALDSAYTAPSAMQATVNPSSFAPRNSSLKHRKTPQKLPTYSPHLPLSSAANRIANFATISRHFARQKHRPITCILQATPVFPVRVHAASYLNYEG